MATVASVPAGAISETNDNKPSLGITTNITDPLSVVIPPSNDNDIDADDDVRPFFPAATVVVEANIAAQDLSNVVQDGGDLVNGNVMDTCASTLDDTTEGGCLFGRARSTPGVGLWNQGGGKSARLVLDEEGKIGSYVDFSEFYTKLSSLNEDEKKELDKELALRGGCETIHEESASASTS